MYCLRLLGGAAIEAENGPLAGPVAQRRRLALLALLATAPAGGVSRERMAALLFPEVDAARARHGLSDALHAVRRAFGRDAVVATGDELRLNPELVASDVGAFGAALAVRERERAVALYRGPFLDGFTVPDAPEFERWVEAERQRLARAHARALEELADTSEARGDFVGAAEWWRRLAVSDPCSSRVSLRLMRAMAAAGDCGGALQHAQVHTALVRETLGADPDPAVPALVERLRSGAGASTGVATGDVTGGACVSPLAAAAGVAPATAIVRSDSDVPAAAPNRGDEADLPAPFGAEIPGPRTPAVLPGRGARGTRVRLRSAAFAVAACLALAALGAATHQALAPGTSAARAPAPSDEAAGPLPPVERQRHSIAVLPFTNRGTVDGDDYFSDGLTDEITAALTKVSGLRVASRSSAFAFRERGQDARAVGRRLRVRYVLAGSVQRAGGRLRVRAELADAASGFAVWSDTYDRELRDVFAVQEEIAQSIMRALRLTLADGGPARLAEPPTADLGAHDLYLRGLYFRNKQSADGVRRGVALLEQATARDTGFALAYVALAEAYRLLPNYAGVGSMREALPKARRAATRALALDGTLPEAHASVGMIAALDHDWETAEQAYRQALALRPGSGITHYYYALLLFSTGRIAEARAEAERALATDPTSIPFNNLLGYMLYFSRRYDEAATQARRTLELEPDLPVAHCILGRVHMQQRRAAAALAALHTCARAAGGGMEWGDLGYAYVLAGQPERARELLGELDQRADGGFVSPIDRAKIHTALGEREQAVEWLERGYADREMNMRDLALEPLFDPLRMEPRFSALLRRMRVK